MIFDPISEDIYVKNIVFLNNQWIEIFFRYGITESLYNSLGITPNVCYHN